MSSPKAKHKKQYFLLLLLIPFFAILFFFWDHLTNEDRDYALNAQVIALARQLDNSPFPI